MLGFVYLFFWTVEVSILRDHYRFPHGFSNTEFMSDGKVFWISKYNTYC